MRFVLFTLLLLLNFNNKCYCAIDDSEGKRIKTFIKVWGFLKYYHPSAGSGDMNWDGEFLNNIDSVSKIENNADANIFYLKWIESLGKIDECKNCFEKVSDSLKYNLDLEWINDSVTFSKELNVMFNKILSNRNPSGNAYVQYHFFSKNTKYSGEKVYSDSVYPASGMRLLSLARYWNIIEYFFPYKYLIGQNWNNVLTEMIPEFRSAPDTISYHMAMRELTAKINDSHAGFTTRYTNQYFGFKWVPFKFKIIDNKAVVKDFYNDSLCKINDILIGDVFLEVGGETIESIIRKKSRFIGASNEPTRLRNFYYAIFNGNTDSVEVKFERNGIISSKILKRYLFTDFKTYEKAIPEEKAFKILDGNIGYVNLGQLETKEVKRMMKDLSSTKAIIFDVRNYPNGTMYKIANFLNKKKKTFAKFMDPDLSYPGVMMRGPTYYCGSSNENYYKGKVVLLFDETSQSHAEFTIMALQTAPDVLSVGSQTAGADGNVSSIILPGNYKTFMTGMGVYYPDGRETQRIGMIPDFEVKPTIAGIKAGKDEVLQKAIELINK